MQKMEKFPDIEIRECKSVEELSECVRLQREVFALPEIEISPVRHFIVTNHAGGFTLGAFYEERLIGFVLSVPAFLKDKKAFYSHMTAVDKDFQSYGIGAKLKWSQREKALEKGVEFIKWTFQPVMARNAFFNLEKLGAIVSHYESNFYGTDYSNSNESDGKLGLDSDRLFAEWRLQSEKVKALANGEKFVETKEIIRKIETINNWNDLINNYPKQAVEEQTRIKYEFQDAFSENLICRGFERDEQHPNFLLYGN
jgi:predicted GNAT superfamily acetyltransferase